MKHGRGKLTLENSSYDGQWKKDKKHGWGVYEVSKPTPFGELIFSSFACLPPSTRTLIFVRRPTSQRAAPTTGLIRYEGEWEHDSRTGKGISTGGDGHVELCRYDNGLRVGEGVRLMDETRLDRWDNEERGPWRMDDGEELEVIDVDAALAIAQRLGLDLPRDPKFGTAPASVARSTASSQRSNSATKAL